MLTPTTTAIIAIGALIIFGPKRLPELARSLGKSLSEFKAGATEAQETFKRELNAGAQPEATHASEPAAPSTASEPKNENPPS